MPGSTAQRVWRRYPDEPKCALAIVTELSISAKCHRRVMPIVICVSSVVIRVFWSEASFLGCCSLNAFPACMCHAESSKLSPSTQATAAAAATGSLGPTPLVWRFTTSSLRWPDKRKPTAVRMSCCIHETAAKAFRHRVAACTLATNIGALGRAGDHTIEKQAAPETSIRRRLTPCCDLALHTHAHSRQRRRRSGDTAARISGSTAYGPTPPVSLSSLVSPRP